MAHIFTAQSQWFIRNREANAVLLSSWLAWETAHRQIGLEAGGGDRGVGSLHCRRGQLPTLLQGKDSVKVWVKNGKIQ